MKMKMMTVCLVVLFALAMCGVTQAQQLDAWGKVVTPGTWDLDKGDVHASLTLDFTNIPVGWNVFQFGLVAQGQANYDTGVWLQVRPHGSDDTFSGGYEVFDMHDHILLQRRADPANEWPTTEEAAYDAVNPNEPAIQSPFGTTQNVGFYFDRGDVTDPVQQGLFGYSDGGNYNTGGTYEIELLFTKVNATQGAVFATINGVSQGIYSGGSPNYANEPDYYPAGLGFSTADFGGSFANLEVWYGQASAGEGYSSVSNVSVIPEPTSLLLLVMGAMCLLLRRRRK